MAVPLARSTPLPDGVTVTLRDSMSVAETIPLPVRLNASSEGTATSTCIGLFVVKLRDVFPITRTPDRTGVVTRLNLLSSA
jgi:hypothetical protein